MWYKKAKTLIDVIIVGGIVLSILIGGGLAFLLVNIGYAMPIEGALAYFIGLAIGVFLVFAAGGSGMTYISVIGLGLIAEIAENTAKIEENTRQKQQTVNIQKYNYR